MIFAIIGVVLGVLIGLGLPFTYNLIYSLSVSVSILSCLDSLLGGLRANLEDNFDITIFVSGFFINSLMAGFLVYIGDKLGVPLYYAAIFTFGNRLFENIAKIRRLLLERLKVRMER